MLRIVILLLVSLILQIPASSAQTPAQSHTRARIQQRLNEASTYFSQNDFLMGANRINEACSLLKSSPLSMPDASYIAIASKTVDDLDGKIQNAKSSGDNALVTKLVGALEPLATSLSNWDPQNPRWHYERGLVLKTQAGLQQYQSPVTLQSAIREFDAALALQGGGSVRASAQEMKSNCQKELQKIQAAINAPSRYRGRSPAGGSSRSSDGGPWFCHSCGNQLSSQYSRCTSCGAF